MPDRWASRFRNCTARFEYNPVLVIGALVHDLPIQLDRQLQDNLSSLLVTLLCANTRNNELAAPALEHNCASLCNAFIESIRNVNGMLQVAVRTGVPSPQKKNVAGAFTGNG